MRKAIHFLRRKSANYHMPIHVILGIFAAYFTSAHYPDYPKNTLILYGITGNLLPDIDHIFYIFLYAKHSDYSKKVKNYLKTNQFNKLFKFLKNNHKHNTGIYSHNFISLAISVTLFWNFGFIRNDPASSVFFLSWSIHYLYDLSEDILFFKRLNPNWY